jgi:hypothetical protein
MPLSLTARHHYYNDLGKALPLAKCYEEHERRQVTAIEAFEALHPGDAWEASLAVQAVLAAVHAGDCMQEAKRHQDDFSKAARCKAQFASLMREMRANRRMLMQEQKMRHGVERVAGGAAAVLLPPPAVPLTPPAERPSARPSWTEPSSAELEQAAAGPPRHAAKPPSPPRAAGALSRPSPGAIAPAVLAAARVFMRQHRVAAARIRADRGITQKCRKQWEAVLPADPAVIEALVRSPRKLLLAQDAANEAPRQMAA